MKGFCAESHFSSQPSSKKIDIIEPKKNKG